jgi:hypothetical protein
MTMAPQFFDDGFLGRLAVAIGAVEQEKSGGGGQRSLTADDYEAIYVAYAESGGDADSARRQIASARGECDQALGRIAQSVSDLYGSGPIERLTADGLQDVTRDAVDASDTWTEQVETRGARNRRENPFQALLETHRTLTAAMQAMQDDILWPLAGRIFPCP